MLKLYFVFFDEFSQPFCISLNSGFRREIFAFFLNIFAILMSRKFAFFRETDKSKILYLFASDLRKKKFTRNDFFFFAANPSQTIRIKHDLMVPAIPALSHRTTSRQSPSVLNLNIIHKNRFQFSVICSCYWKYI